MSTIAELTGIEVPTGLLIGGEWAGGHGGGTFPVLDPATEEPLAEVADGTVEDALDAVGAAHAALPAWAATPPRQRAEILRRAFELMTARAEQFATADRPENGKSLRDARGEATYAAEFFRWYAEEAVRIAGHAQSAPSGANRILVLRQPIGVSAAGHALELPGRDGHPQDRPGARRRLHRRAQARQRDAADRARDRRAAGSEAGVPAGVVNVLTSRKSGADGVGDAARPAGAQALLHRLDRGRPHAAARRPPSTVVSSSMELGGNAPFLVFEDADIDAAVDGRDDRQDAQRRRGLHRGQPLLRARVGGRRVHRALARAWRRWRSGPASRKRRARPADQ